MEMLKFPRSTMASFQEELAEENDEESRTLWVGNIEEEVDNEILFELFLNSGPVSKVTIPRNKQSKQSKGFAFILFEHRESVPYAIQQMSGTALYGRTIVLKPHARRTATNDRSCRPKNEMRFTSYNWEISGVADTLQEINQNDPKGTFEFGGSQYSNVKVRRTHDYSINDSSMVKNLNAERSRDNQEQSRERHRRGERSEYEYMRRRRSKSQQLDLRDKVNRRKTENRRIDDKYSHEMSHSSEIEDMNVQGDKRSREKYYESSSRNERSHERQKRDRSHSRRNHTETSEKDKSSMQERYRSRRYQQSSRDDVERSDTAFRDRSRRRLNRSKEREYSHNMSPTESTSRGDWKSHNRRKYLQDRSVSRSPDSSRMDQKRNKYSDQGRD